MKNILFLFLLFMSSIEAMRKRSNSITFDPGINISSARPRSNSLSTPRRSKSDSTPKNIRISPKKRRSLSFSAKKIKTNKETSLVKKLRKAIQAGTITENEIQAIQFLLDVATKKKEKEQKQKELEQEQKKQEQKIFFEKDVSIKLYEAVKQANNEIKESKKISEVTRTKICFLLSSGARVDEVMEESNTSYSIALKEVKKIIDDWQTEGWSPRKQEILNEGMQYWS